MIDVMKQIVQNLKALRTMPGRFLALAGLAAVTFTFTPSAQADSGQGAVVTHIDRDRTGWFYALSPDGQLRLDVATSGQGDLLRLNPDGTLTLEVVEPKTPMKVSVSDGSGGWAPVWAGTGSLHDTFSVVQEADGSLSSTGEDDAMHVEAKLTNLLDGSEWSLLVVAAIVDFEVKELKIDLQPR
jgi:hypothetical protein